ncbi:unnamed protein product [Calypogeia fissa]
MKASADFSLVHVSQCSLNNKLAHVEVSTAQVDVEVTQMDLKGPANEVYHEAADVAKKENQLDLKAIGTQSKISVRKEHVEASVVYMAGTGIIESSESAVSGEGTGLGMHDGTPEVNIEAPNKQLDDEGIEMHAKLPGARADFEAIGIIEAASDNKIDIERTRKYLEGIEKRVETIVEQGQVTGTQVNGGADGVPKPPVRRVITFAEVTAKTQEKESKLSEQPVKARGLQVEVTEKNVGIEATEADRKENATEKEVEVTATEISPVTVRRITAVPEVISGSLEAQGMISELPLVSRVGFQDSADPDDGGSESIGEDLDSESLDETSESLEDISNESDEEDAGGSSNSVGEVPLKDEDLQELVDQLLKAESEAAEAQEMLEEESLASVRDEVKAELAETFSGPELDAKVDEEMRTYIETWEESCEELQEECSLLQEELEDAGVDLPDLYKRIEKQAPEGCSTEAWKQRTHWAGHQPTQEVEVVVKRAEEELKIRHPTRRRRGRLADEGASGFLERKLAAQGGDDGEVVTTNLEHADDGGWSKVNDFLHNEDIPQPGTLMGTKRWAAVYLASTPEQAVQLGLALPGVDTVEEIGDMESEPCFEFKVAFANEKERGLTDQQRKSIKKVRDEDDVKRSRKIKKEWKMVPKQRHAKNSLKEGGAQLTSEAIRQPKKLMEQSLVVSSNGESESVVKQSTADSGSDVIDPFTHDEGTQSVVSKGAAGHVKAVSENEDGTVTRTAPPEDDVELGSNGLESGGEHEVTPHSLPKATCSDGARGKDLNGVLTHAAQVKIEESNQSENEGFLMTPAKRTDHPDAVQEMSHVLMLPPKSELSDTKRKRVHDDERQQDDSGDHLTPKRRTSVNTKDADMISQGSQKELLRANSDGLGSDAQNHDSPLTTVLYRTTVVIDSDGEREIEEAVAETVRLSTPSRSYPNRLGDVRQRPGQADPVGDARKRKWKQSPMKEKDFPCTACGTLMRKKDVLRHPKLAVGICKRCRKHYLSGPFKKDEDGSDSECSWCGEGGEVVCCGRCDKVFCQACITRNFSTGETLRIVTMDDWLCYFCNPLPLSGFTRQLIHAEKEAGAASGDMEARSAVQDFLTSPVKESSRQSKKGKHRKNIRKVLDDDELEEKQKELLAREKERQERLEQWREAAGSKITSNPARRKSFSAEVPKATGEDTEDLTGEDTDDLINVARAENEAPVKLDHRLASVLKEHQLCGVRFMWENCIVSEQKVREGGDSFGCILAHSMGLGKTLQVITLIHTVLNRNLGLNTALIVVPVNVLHNWRREFEIWQAEVTNPVAVYMLEESTRENAKRAALLSQWKEDGGVMLIGYTPFRNLSLGTHVRDKTTRDELCCALQNPGPDLLVCDEAHTIKNGKADITQVLKQVKTRRRIALTGSPMQNNLMEYYCMVDFVREGFLGSPQVFKNRFQNPIENGQHADSTLRDVKLMKQRAHVLHEQLKGFVQRMNTSVLKDELPPKCVYVISVRLSPIQRKLYAHYLQVHGLQQDEDEATEDKSQRKYLFPAYWALAKVWNHPDLLLIAEEEANKKQEDCAEGFIADSEEERFSETEIGAEFVRKGKGKGRPLKKKGSTELDELEKPLWWKGVIPEDYSRENVDVGGKMVLLLRLLAMFSRRGDKALIFSQSLGTLGLIERFLEKGILLEPNWERDKHWYRLDGSTPAAARMQMCERFNDPKNVSVKCVLISTKAGSLGINLPAANRVIIVDGSWNPTHDLQALFRAWRLGQKKPVYAYRLLAHGTMEEKIYSRQVAKEGVAARVLDEQQVGRHFDTNDLEHLFRLEDDGDDFVEESVASTVNQLSIGPSGALVGSVSVGSKSKLLSFTLPADAPPRDDVMGALLIKCRPRWVVSYHEHEPLLEHREEENLTMEEQKAAWESYKVEGMYGVQVVQNVSTTVIATANTYPNTVTTFSSTVGTSTVRCSTKDHAAILSETKVGVSSKIVCATCLLLISWENLHGQERPLQPGG